MWEHAPIEPAIVETSCEMSVEGGITRAWVEIASTGKESQVNGFIVKRALNGESELL